VTVAGGSDAAGGERTAVRRPFRAKAPWKRWGNLRRVGNSADQRVSALQTRLRALGRGRWAAGVEMKALGPEGKSARIDDSMRAGQVI